MKSLLFLAAAVALSAADGPVTYADHAKVAEALVKGGALARGSDFTVSGAHR